MAGNGIPYFPLNCQLDEKFELIEAEFGIKGFAVLIKLFQRIYGEHGYYCEWNRDIALLFARKIGLSSSDASRATNDEDSCGFSDLDNGRDGYSGSGDGANFIHMVVGAATKRGIFSKELFQEYHILTSKGIQMRYLDAVSRRKKIELCEEYLLISPTQISKNVDIFSKNVYKNAKNVYISEQRKEEKRKEKKRKEEKSKSGCVGDFGNLFSVFESCGFRITGYTAQELPALAEMYSEEWVVAAIKRAADRGNLSLGYVKGILNNWQMAGAMDEKRANSKGKTAEGREAENYGLPY